MVKTKKPNGYWTKEKCHEKALLCKSRKEFGARFPSAYIKAGEKGWKNDICTHMVVTQHPKSYWTKDKCQEVALLCESRSKFQRRFSAAYAMAGNKGWRDDICTHMVETKKLNGFWDKEKCHEKALICSSRKEFSDRFPSAYGAAGRKGWRDEICSHMVAVHKPKGYWNKEKCQEVALEYEYRSEFSNLDGGAYNYAMKNGFLSEICSHMKFKASNSKRKIYVYEFENSECYVGLTWDPVQRHSQHKSRGLFKTYPHLNNFDTPIYSDWLSESEAVKKEKETISKYENLGWTLLNQRSGGSLGGANRKWTKEKCIQEALKYKTRGDFFKGNDSAYNSSRKYGWFEEICSHMTWVNRPNGYWTKERCHEKALLYKTRSEFKGGFPSAYKSARERKILDEICDHMADTRKPNGYWTKEKCHEKALLCESKIELKEKYISAYQIVYRNGWGNEIYSHMKPKDRTRKWTKEKCHEKALLCKSRKEFEDRFPSAYGAAGKKGWKDEICSHMTFGNKPRGYWTKEKCHEKALLCKTMSEFYTRFGSAYTISRAKGWQNEICSHMTGN